jgi:hypothetical protein
MRAKMCACVRGFMRACVDVCVRACLDLWVRTVSSSVVMAAAARQDHHDGYVCNMGMCVWCVCVYDVSVCVCMMCVYVCVHVCVCVCTRSSNEYPQVRKLLIVHTACTVDAGIFALKSCLGITF